MNDNSGRESDAGQREWFTAAELAELGLPGLPGDKRGINRRAEDERWYTRTGRDGEPLVRERKGRGGGWLYHYTLLPSRALIELSRLGLIAAHQTAEPESDRDAAWRWFDGQSARVKAKAETKLEALDAIELLTGSGMTKTAAVSRISIEKEVSVATLYNWIKEVAGIARADWLPALAPRQKGGGKSAEIDADLWQLFLSDYLRPSAPTLTSCYDRVADVAEAEGLSIPSEAAFRRRLKKDVDPSFIVLKREGKEALRRRIPAQRRTVEHLHAMEHVNIDGHRFDVFVRTPDGRVIRPTMVAIQDVYSRKILAWRIGETESSVLTRLAFADLFRDWGIPRACTLDNGRAFASKWITGGADNRYRFKVREDEPTGLLTGLGIEIHWALPYRGQSKPIERAFRDLCDTLAKHPRMEGAYTGNKPDAKPENYRSRAIEWDEFIAHADEQIARHNARTGRRSQVAKGRSFDEVFAESYAKARVPMATEGQLRTALLTADQVTVNRQTGVIELYGNRYWSEACTQLHGQKVTVRFDPDDLHSEIHIYRQSGEFIATIPIWHDSGFNDVAEARSQAKRTSDLNRRVREGEEAHALLSAAQVAARQPIKAPADIPDPDIVQLVHHRGQTAAALKPRARPAPKAAEPLPQEGSKVLSLLGRLKPEE